jgi:6,7-dimethyl-8-ribityllumazine synthase
MAGSSKPVAGSLTAAGLRFGLVVSRFNSFITERLLAGARDALRRAGAADAQINVVHVPGSFEIPIAAKKLAHTGTCDAIVCIGCVLRGDTSHYDYVCAEAARGIQLAQMDTGVPMAFCLLTCDTLEQAIDRAGLKSGNKGYDAGLAAIEMANLARKLKPSVAGSAPAPGPQKKKTAAKVQPGQGSRRGTTRQTRKRRR